MHHKTLIPMFHPLSVYTAKFPPDMTGYLRQRIPTGERQQKPTTKQTTTGHHIHDSIKYENQVLQQSNKMRNLFRNGKGRKYVPSENSFYQGELGRTRAP
jgi:hypothetical protein